MPDDNLPTPTPQPGLDPILLQAAAGSLVRLVIAILIGIGAIKLSQEQVSQFVIYGSAALVAAVSLAWSMLASYRLRNMPPSPRPSDKPDNDGK